MIRRGYRPAPGQRRAHSAVPPRERPAAGPPPPARSSRCPRRRGGRCRQRWGSTAACGSQSVVRTLGGRVRRLTVPSGRISTTSTSATDGGVHHRAHQPVRPRVRDRGAAHQDRRPVARPGESGGAAEVRRRPAGTASAARAARRRRWRARSRHRPTAAAAVPDRARVRRPAEVPGRSSAAARDRRGCCRPGQRGRRRGAGDEPPAPARGSCRTRSGRHSSTSVSAGAIRREHRGHQ